MKRILFVMFSSVLITFMLTACGKNIKSEYNSKSISLYQKIRVQEDYNEIYKFNKIITITDRKTVEDIENKFTKFNFSELSEGEVANLTLNYYLVFDDTGTVLQFGDATTDMGRIGTNFNVGFKGINRYKETELFTCDLTKYVHIPLKAISLLNKYLE